MSEEEVGSTSSIARSAAVMSAATLGSRITGLLRTWTQAFALGNTVITSAYQVANNLPNVIYELVAGGLLAAAFVPVYLEQKEKLGTEGGNNFACDLLNVGIIVLGALAILTTVFAPQVVATQTFTVGDTAEVSQLATNFFRIFAMQILFYGIGGVITSVLNANRVYFLPSIAPALNNIVCIASFLAYIPLSQTDPNLALTVLAWGTSIGVAVQFAIQIPALKKTGFKWRAHIDWHDPALKDAVKIALPTVIYIVGTMVSFSCRNAFSLQAGDNGPSTLNYAWTWYQLPYGVIAVSLSRPLFTEMSDDVAKDNWDKFRHHAASGMSSTLFLVIPLAGLIGALAVPIMQLFQAGAFDADDVSFVASILAIWVVSLPFYSILMYLYNVFASIRHFTLFAVVSTVMVVVQCALYGVLCQPNVIGLAGVPIADLVYYGVCCIILLIVLRHYVGPYGLRSIVSSAVRVLAATLIGCVVVNLVYGWLPSGQGILWGLFYLVVCGIIGLVLIFGLCALFRVPEMSVLKQLLAKLRRRKAA